MLNKIFGNLILMFAFLCLGCSKGEVNNQISLSGNSSVVSGEQFEITYSTKNKYESVYAELVDNNDNVIEMYGLQNFDRSYNISRIINTPNSSISY